MGLLALSVSRIHTCRYWHHNNSISMAHLCLWCANTQHYGIYSPFTVHIHLLLHLSASYSIYSSNTAHKLVFHHKYSPLLTYIRPYGTWNHLPWHNLSPTHTSKDIAIGVLQKSASRRIKENHLCGATSRIWGNKVPSSWDAKYSKHGPPSECLHEASMTLRRIIKLWTPSRHVRNHFKGYLHEPKCKSAWKPC